jgi:hypothetical protein
VFILVDEGREQSAHSATYFKKCTTRQDYILSTELHALTGSFVMKTYMVHFYTI